MKNIAANIKQFTHNPMGIIALFMTIIYGIFGYVLTQKSALSTNQMWLLLSFLICFPFVVLVSFVYLVIKHHHKLYAPKDFNDDKSFLHAMGITEKIAKVEREIDNELNRDGSPDNAVVEPRTSASRTQLVHHYLEIEERALAFLDKTKGIKLTATNVAIGTGTKSDEWDAIGNTREAVVGVEIKYSKRGYIPSDVIESIFKRAERSLPLLANSRAYNSYILALVFVWEDNPYCNAFKAKVAEMVQDADYTVDTYFINVEDLPKKGANQRY